MLDVHSIESHSVECCRPYSAAECSGYRESRREIERLAKVLDA